ncbi:MAG: hypothetical protein QF752_04625 [Planctomycetota bacterium]|jgi:hypothetical protein|nr:hypothetical protein [Planctomycetota bacterium]
MLKNYHSTPSLPFLRGYLVLLLVILGSRATSDSWREAIVAMRPPAQEKWRQIPWRTDLAASRLEAARLGRPLFIWSMNGHPLGCT